MRTRPMHAVAWQAQKHAVCTPDIQARQPAAERPSAESRRAAHDAAPELGKPGLSNTHNCTQQHCNQGGWCQDMRSCPASCMPARAILRGMGMWHSMHTSNHIRHSALASSSSAWKPPCSIINAAGLAAAAAAAAAAPAAALVRGCYAVRAIPSSRTHAPRVGVRERRGSRRRGSGN